MSDVVRGGHNPQCSGASAILDEVTEDRLVKNAIIKYRKLDNSPILDVTPGNCDEDTDLAYGVNLADSIHANLYSIHFNKAYEYKAEAIGSEIWINPNNPKSVLIANRILSNLHSLGFINRGIKDGMNDEHLYEVRNTEQIGMIIEVCFVESVEDVRIYKEVGFDRIGKAIAEGIVGHTIIGSETVIKPINTMSYIVTNYIPYSSLGVEIRALEAMYFPGVDRIYIKFNSKGIWFETQWLTQAKCDELSVKLKANKLFYAIQK